ncbi:sugar phosphate nucleotidyltransferase [Candidatus Margulisiibacteriota bacterium]
MKAVILAGGKGTRLAPYTTVFPKPLMPLGDKPILETIIKQLKLGGITEIILAVGYLSDLIKAYFGDGSQFGVKIRYSKEEKPLGTAGPLSMIDGLDGTFLVMNGDILSSISLDQLLAFHKKSQAVATIAVNQRSQKVNYGVIEVDGSQMVSDYIEKPSLDYRVSMGIYLFEPEVLKHIPSDQYLDFPDLIKQLLTKQKKVAAYLSKDYWLDIGRHDDYDRAQKGSRKSAIFVQ